MAKHLVIVESPAKAKTINKFLGKDYRVKASRGHVRDLPKNPKKKGDKDYIGVDEERGFRPEYEILKDKEKTIDEIVNAAKEAETILLAADPDREGEAICWHLKEILKKKRIVRPIQRVLFNEITKRAVRGALEHPRDIDGNKVDAQEARRILDRIVGYRVSPLLWDRVRRGLSAGRVQTVALRMIVERERELRAFVPVEYWTVSARLEPEARNAFEAKLVGWRGRDVPWVKKSGDEKLATLPNEAAAREVVDHCSGRPFVVGSVEAKSTRRNPPPPFTTSKLQQEAARRFRLPVRRTMSLAQSLYEGKDLGKSGAVGLITYMRTDSTRVAGEALEAVRGHIAQVYGAPFLPEEPRYFRQGKATQDAHEAIRPTSLELTPDAVVPFLDKDEAALYRLIWDRFVASQMAAAEFDVTTIEMSAGEALFRATGQVQKFAGWLAVYQETREEDAEDENGVAALPAVNEGERFAPAAVTPTQNATQPPQRYTEAMLVRALEENGIGRPSTYAAILGVLSEQDYVDKLEGRLKPTDLGEIVLDLLVKHFGDIFDVAFTARMEEELDEVEGGQEKGVNVLREFSSRFRVDLERARKEMENVKQRAVKTDIPCEACGQAMMVKRWGRFGEFLACERYPECKNTRDLAENSKPLPEVQAECPNCGRPMAMRRGRWGPFLACSGYPECKTTQKIKVHGGRVEVKKEVVLDEKCPDCGKPLAQKHGRFGEYVGCTGYPDCRYTRQEETGVSCPKCGKSVVGRRSRRGKTFYGCTGYPKCDFVLWKKPIAKPCPKCGAPYVSESITKRHGARLICEKEGCGHVEVLAAPEKHEKPAKPAKTSA